MRGRSAIANTSNIQELLHSRASMPSQVLEENGLLPSGLDGNYKILLDEIQREWDAIGAWLEYFLLDKGAPDLDLIHQKPAAEKDRALLKFLQELYLRVSWVPSLTISPGFWWKGILFERLVNTFQSNGFLGQKTIRSKSGDCDRACEHFRAMEDMKAFTSLEKLDSKEYLLVEIGEHRYVLEADAMEQPMTTIMNMANATASHCVHFRNGPLKDYLQRQKRGTRSIRDNPELKYVGIDDDGSIWIGGRGKGTRKKRQRLDTS